jgi:predicted RNA polymerase sigma factor
MALYEVLLQLQENPVVSLNHAVAVAMVHGPDAGLALLDALEKPLAQDHRLHAVRAHLLEMAGDHPAARDCYEYAARLTMSIPQQRYLQARATNLKTPS